MIVDQVSGLQAGQTYRLHVSAGVGTPSLNSEPIRAQINAGTKEIEIGIDNDGFVFLRFEASETTDKDFFKWNKNYTEYIDAE
ncbi:myomesin-3-like [Myxocyprinus asiaticus]|uniref:myomesin-3-like n=1 Tax=Myxocyprinus asiaticus TaxID=70543 RepID=UPI002221D96A|nr:myomesin-3-like [Myxocyprinus asiaticus]